MEGDSQSKTNSTTKLGKMVLNASTVFQSIWFRHCTILANNVNWESLVCQHRIVLFSGTILWLIHIFSR